MANYLCLAFGYEDRDENGNIVHPFLGFSNLKGEVNQVEQEDIKYYLLCTIKSEKTTETGEIESKIAAVGLAWNIDEDYNNENQITIPSFVAVSDPVPATYYITSIEKCPDTLKYQLAETETEILFCNFSGTLCKNDTYLDPPTTHWEDSILYRLTIGSYSIGFGGEIGSYWTKSFTIGEGAFSPERSGSYSNCPRHYISGLTIYSTSNITFESNSIGYQLYWNDKTKGLREILLHAEGDCELTCNSIVDCPLLTVFDIQADNIFIQDYSYSSIWNQMDNGNVYTLNFTAETEIKIDGDYLKEEQYVYLNFNAPRIRLLNGFGDSMFNDLERGHNTLIGEVILGKGTLQYASMGILTINGCVKADLSLEEQPLYYARISNLVITDPQKWCSSRFSNPSGAYYNIFSPPGNVTHTTKVYTSVERGENGELIGETLQTLAIDDDVEVIGECAFSGIESLKVLKLHSLSSVSTPKLVIEKGAFAGCSSLTTLTSKDGGYMSFQKIEHYAFGFCDIQEIQLIPRKNSIIEQEAFERIHDGGVVRSPFIENDWPTNWSRNAFLNYTTINYGAGIAGAEGISFEVEDAASGYGKKITKIKKMNSSVNDDGLTELRIPYEVTGLVEDTDSTDIEIVTEISENVFDVEDGGLRIELANINTVLLPHSINTIGTDVFKDATAITKVCIYKGILQENETKEKTHDILLKSWASIKFGNAKSNPLNGKNAGLYIENYLYDKSIEEVTRVFIQDDIIIQSYAFTGCSTIKQIELLKVNSINDHAFDNCTNLEDIKLNFSGTSATRQIIGESAFSDCPKIANITITGDLNEIRHKAFYLLSQASENPPAIKIAIGSPKQWCNIKFISEYSNPGYGRTPVLSLINSGLATTLTFDEVSNIPAYAFYNCNIRPGVEFTISLLTIERYAFGTSNPNTINTYYTGTAAAWNSVSVGGGNSNLKAPIFNKTHGDTDFIGFTYNGLHFWYDLNILRVSPSMYTMNLAPGFKDVTAEAPGMPGKYYLNSNHTERTFTVDIAFENLEEKQLRQLRQLCADTNLHDLIFDEEPYKVYTAKIANNPNISFIPFEIEDGYAKKRLYKGSGQLQFICYYPYAHTPDADTRVSKVLVSNTGRFGKDGKDINSYSDLTYNKYQWNETSGIRQYIPGNNNGDIPAHFTLVYKNTLQANSSLTLQVGEASITIKSNDKAYKDITWDSKTGLVTAKVGDSEATPIYYTGDSCATIPVGGVTNISNNVELKYHYWYY